MVESEMPAVDAGHGMAADNESPGALASGPWSNGFMHSTGMTPWHVRPGQGGVTASSL